MIIPERLISALAPGQMPAIQRTVSHRFSYSVV